MKLRIQNVAKIKSAELELNGITVIAGNNNTGKSTVGKTVFSMFNSLVNIGDKIGRQKEKLVYQMLLRKGEAGFELESEMITTVKVSPTRLRRYARELVKEAEKTRLEEITQEFCRSVKISTADFAQDVEEEVYRIKNLPEERLVKSAVTAYFDQIFNSEINNIYRADDDAAIEAEIKGRKIAITFRENSCIEFQQQMNILNEAVYLDNPFILDCLNNGIYSVDPIEQVAISKLRRNTDVVENVVQYNFVEDRMQEVLDKINEVSAGSLQMDESRSYRYKENAAGAKISVNNLSAGLKSFVIIKTLLENGALKEKDVLILDEPEIHLHPAWQITYAEVIILLQKVFDLTIILTTHSSHFMEALQLFAKKYNMEEKCSYYLSHEEDDGCVLEDVSSDITKIYSQLVDPSIMLDKLRYEMDEAEDE